AAEAEEGDGGLGESIDVERVHVLGRAGGAREGEVALEQRADVLGPRVVDPDLALGRAGGAQRVTRRS
ncbi:MAG TPA: hypothetical protein VG295_06495, partial [Solirubrobacteraceae bacterium]|nr:hypothetical protein [Solirubrobacteraceae bacterium]